MCQVWRDGSKWRDVSTHTNLTTGVSAADETLCTDGSLTEVYLDPATRSFQGPDAAVVAWVDKVPDAERADVSDVEFGVITHGYLVGNNGILLPQILAGSQRNARKATEAGKEFSILEATSEWGRLEIWLDPSRGFAPFRIEQRKTSGDWYERGRALASIPVRKGTIYPESPETAMLLDMQATEYAHLKDRDLVTGLTLHLETQFANGQSVVRQWTIRFSDFDFAPHEAFAINTSVPNGTRVQVNDHPNIEYEWRDGKIVKKVNTASLNDLGGNFFKAGGWWRIVYILLGLVPILVAAVSVWWWMRRTRKKAKP